MGQIKAKSPKIGSSCFVTLIATTEFRELNILVMLYWADFPKSPTEPLMTRISLGYLHSTCPAAWNLCKARLKFHLPWNQFKSISLFSLQHQVLLFCLPLSFLFFSIIKTSLYLFLNLCLFRFEIDFKSPTHKIFLHNYISKCFFNTFFCWLTYKWVNFKKQKSLIV